MQSQVAQSVDHVLNSEERVVLCEQMSVSKKQKKNP